MSGIHKSDSSEQRDAEHYILDGINRIRGLSLRREPLKLKSGIKVELDGYDPDKRVLCEVYAHIGPLKGSQPDKVAGDILKMLLVEHDLGGLWHKIYGFADKTAAQKPSGVSWLACAAKQFGVEPVVIELPKNVYDLALNAQNRQTMVNKK